MYDLYFHIVDPEHDTHKSVSKIRTKKVYWFAPPHRCPEKQLYYHDFKIYAYVLSWFQNIPICTIMIPKYTHMYYHDLKIYPYLLWRFQNILICTIMISKYTHMYYHDFKIYPYVLSWFQNIPICTNHDSKIYAYVLSWLQTWPTLIYTAG